MKNVRTITVQSIIDAIPNIEPYKLRLMLEQFSREAYNQGEIDEQESNQGYDTYSK